MTASDLGNPTRRVIRKPGTDDLIVKVTVVFSDQFHIFGR